MIYNDHHRRMKHFLYPSFETMGWQRRGGGVGEMRGSQLHNSHRTSSVTATSNNSIATTTLSHLSRVDIEDTSPISVFECEDVDAFSYILMTSLHHHLTNVQIIHLNCILHSTETVTAAIQNHPSLICHFFNQ